MVIRMRHTKAHTRNRRSHHKAEGGTVSVDAKTGVPHLRHRASLETGRYRDRQVIDVVSKVQKKQAKKSNESQNAR